MLFRSRADVVLYDALANPRLLDYAPAKAERIYVGKKRAQHEMSQEEIHALLIEKARAGANVVRLKGGDPFIFGRGGEEVEALAAAGIARDALAGVVVGAGPAGLNAVLPAARAGLRVVLIEEAHTLGGSLLARDAQIDGQAGTDWSQAIAQELDGLPNVLVLKRTSVFGYYDHNYLMAVERRTDHIGPAQNPGVARKRLWHLRAQRVVLATGTHERPIPFGDNDRPGIVLSGAACTYAYRYGMRLGDCGVAFVNNDVGFTQALETHALCHTLTHIIDARDSVDPGLLRRADEAGRRQDDGRRHHRDIRLCGFAAACLGLR